MEMTLEKWLRTFIFNKRGRTITTGAVGSGAKIVAPNSGRDPMSSNHVGRRDGLTPGHFRVRLRYASPDDARHALQNAPVEQERDGVVIVHLDVPAIPREHYDTENLPHEIRCDW
jgi:hypothetical protein